MTIRIAGLTIDVKNKYPYFNSMCTGYEAPENSAVDFSVEVPDEVLNKTKEDNPDFSDGYLESLEIYRIICSKILDYNAMLIHCAAICVDGEAYLFTAVSGTGKTTHMNLWRKKFQERCFVVNGDKPILRFKGDKCFVCGTPWKGKEGYGHNAVVPVKAICILERGKENKIERVKAHEAIPTVITQTLRTGNLEEMGKMLSLTDKLLLNVPFYRLQCNMDPEAADVSYNGMK